MQKFSLFFLIASLTIGCSGTKQIAPKKIKKKFQSSFYENQFTGLLVVNPKNGDKLLHFNDKKYFTPASNAKIFTLFTALNYLPDSIPALRYIDQNDTLYIEGTGDPTLLHTHFKQNNTLDFIKRHKNIALHLNNFKDKKYGPGWAWEDYQYYFQPENGSFPMYGNVTTISNTTAIQVRPAYFKDSVQLRNVEQNRDKNKNHFYFNPKRVDTLEIPFITSNLLTKELLEKVLQKEVRLVNQMPQGDKKVIYSVASDSVYKRMMIESDNFLADQLLLSVSSTLSDSLNSNKAITSVLENELADLKQPPRWVDGSGLSRYNLFTPESMVHILRKMYQEIPEKRLLNLFAKGGEGTLKNWYPGNPNPYIFAKTGSVGNNHSISGYLKTKSGKTLIFSYMNNHFIRPSSEVKKEIQTLFEAIRDTY